MLVPTVMFFLPTSEGLWYVPEFPSDWSVFSTFRKSRENTAMARKIREKCRNPPCDG